ncbi:MAG: acetamidase/formamidase family protein [Chitinophagaceae bacterium]
MHCLSRFFFCIIAIQFSLFCIAQPGKHIHFTPSVYYREFSAKPEPSLRIKAGDTITTQSVDAGGFDRGGTKVTERGNPLTGPFFIEGAMPGDVLAVKLIDVRLNRNYATTLNTFIPKIFPGKETMKLWRSAKLVRWKLDTVANVGSPADSNGYTGELKVPLHPFLGCVGVAPQGDKGASSGSSGSYGGNMDFLFNTVGATVYLPVSHPGAFLFLGDGHAVQGDGELNGDALETSMHFSFSVSLIKKEVLAISAPVIENDKYWMFFGIEKSLDKSLRKATEAMVLWLEHRYGLSRREASQVVGPAIEYRIPKTAGGITEVVAMIPKDIVRQLESNKK